MDSSTTLEDVKSVIVDTLGLEDRTDTLFAETELFGSLPELDSLALIVLATSLEDRFGFEFNDDDFTGEVFETIGSLTRFVEQQIA